ncbi:MAG: 2-C-methyl-D-erythritol 2,4-cyclodiphosphate synthase [Acidobacteriota bacterium]|nr:MAG: 2-C-methyl-D-erythritol 2,4-cyclodiphosphate synthase [Acidobacteriota bacterium]
MIRIGFGTDIHRLEAGRPLIIGGVEIQSDVGAVGHSDADVLLHAITDAVLGSLALGDIGQHFPDSDERWKGADSLTFLRHANKLISENGYLVVNLDCVIDLESPKLRPHIEQMRGNIAAALDIDIDGVSIKAKTGEKVDAVGERRAIRAQAVVLVTGN